MAFKTTQNTDPKTEKNKPVTEIKIWPVKAAIWNNQTEKGEDFYNVTFQKSYKDREAGDYHNTTSFDREDLLKLAKCADVAHSWIMRQESRKEERKESNVLI
jgi:hypothetical protein